MWLLGSAGTCMQTRWARGSTTLCIVVAAASAAGAGSGVPLPARQEAWEEAADRARTKVIVLKTARASGRASATGFLARPGLVLTAGHVVAEGGTITAWVNGVAYRAEVQAVHPEYDLAALRLRAPELLLKPLELAQSSATLADNEELIILAGPSQPAGARGDPSARVPIRAAFLRRVSLRDPRGRLGVMLVMQASVRRGDSGSPVIRVKDGSVVGMLSSRQLPDAQGISHSAYAVPIDAVHAWLDAPPSARPRGEEDFYLFRLKKREP